MFQSASSAVRAYCASRIPVMVTLAMPEDPLVSLYITAAVLIIIFRSEKRQKYQLLDGCPCLKFLSYTYKYNIYVLESRATASTQDRKPWWCVGRGRIVSSHTERAVISPRRLTRFRAAVSRCCGRAAITSPCARDSRQTSRLHNTAHTSAESQRNYKHLLLCVYCCPRH